MIEQLSFLDWQPLPEMMVEPIAELCEEVCPPANIHAIAWWRERLRYYQRLQKGFFDRAYQSALEGNPNPAIQKMRWHEIARLQGFCEECSMKLKQLRGT